MAIMVGCAALLVAGLVAGVRWGGMAFATPDPDVELSAAEVGRRYVWYLAITFLAGVAAGITVIGAGGRLAMRLLAVTAGDSAQGQITEANEIVGDITLDGTIGFILFNGIFGGVVFGGLFLILRRFLPPGHLGGALYGLGLLLVFGATVDPLRPDNPDFDIVGPGWVAVSVFTLLALGFGLAVQGITAGVSRWLPPPSTERRVLARYAEPAVVALILFTATAFLVLIGFATALATRWHVVVDVVRSPRWILAGRVLLVAVVLVSLPNALTSVIDIVDP